MIAGLVLLVLGISTAEASTVCSSLCDYTTIEDAYNAAASSGDTIDVTDTRTYTESFSISKSITITTSVSSPATWRSDNARDSILTVTGGETVEIEGFIFVPRVDRGLEVDSSSTLTLKNIQIDGFSNTGDNGVGVHADGGSTLIIEDSSFKNLDGQMGAAVFGDNNSDVTLEGCDFDQNTGTWDGGTVAVIDGDLTVNNCTFVNSEAVGWGGTIYVQDTTLIVTSSTFGASETTGGNSEGGHIGIWSNDWTMDNATITNSSFSDGVATGDGGSVGVDFSNFTQSGGSYSNNHTDMDGGALHLDWVGTGSVSDVTFTSNSTDDDGGAVDITGDSSFPSTIDFEANGFTSNTAVDHGGAIRMLEVQSFSFTENQFSLNESGDTGGAFHVNTAEVGTLKDNVYLNNTAIQGGAIRLVSVDDISAVGGYYCGNEALTGRGGAVSISNGGSVGSSWTNNVFSENTAGTRGGAIYATNHDPSIYNNHFLANEASTSGGGLHFNDSDYIFVNNLVAWTVGGDGVAAAWSGTASYTMDYNDWYLNTTSDAAGSLSLGSNSLTVDPLLEDYTDDGDCTNDKMWPTSSSPLIDKGDPSPSLYDPDGTVSDIGAFGGPDADPDLFDDLDGDGYLAIYDCDDDDASIHPGADEICDDLNVDEDCDDLADDDDSSVDATTKTDWYLDGDEDGFGDEFATAVRYCDNPTTATDTYVDDNTDCDDATASVNPDAEEVCDAANVDEDCNGFADDADVDVDVSTMTTWYPDRDKDNYGDEADLGSDYCDDPSTASVDYVQDNTDCNDADNTVYPTASEVVGDEIDQDCDGGEICYADGDDDGYINGVSTVASTTDADCDDSGEADASATTGECDDADAAINPGADEVCDDADVDENCNGVADDADATTTTASMTTYYADDDDDGFGDYFTTTAACSTPSGYVASDTDCDDTDIDIHPDADEYCDGVDNDCDGDTDEGDAVDAITYYADTDGDGYGDPDNTTTACSLPSGYTTDNTDCDDTNLANYPGADEYCDTVDNDCDGTVDESDALDASTWYADLDGDGYGDDTATTTACDQPTGYASEGGDCDESDGDINPGAEEVCDTVDNDCDGTTDGSSATDATTWYADTDDDGYGDATDTVVDCDEPSGYVDNASDCDDTESTISPDADEVCDSIDNDCDGDTDEDDAVDASTWYEDTDGDGFGDSSSTTNACSEPTGYVDDATDCDDTETAINPSADELCDGVDNDCDGDTDEDDAVDASTWYADDDNDGYGDSTSTTTACEEPTGYTDNDTDCDDGNVDINPAAVELCDSVDNDCDGDTDEDDADDATEWYADDDDDGYGDSTDTQTACEEPSGYTALGGDCDDTEGAINPDATEVCDTVDNDCDGDTDEDDAADALTWYLDMDGDNYGLATETYVACEAPANYVADAGDCDDTNRLVYPTATELCDELDNDCDDIVDEDITEIPWYVDVDGDDYGIDDGSVMDCKQPDGYTDRNGDCNDADETIHPAADEIWYDGTDQNCDGNDLDQDFDGFDSAEHGGDDCDDLNAEINPGADEIWYDGIDQNCDGANDFDQDGDGFTSADHEGDDCDDSNEAIHPGAEDVPDNTVDEDCDGTLTWSPTNERNWASTDGGVQSSGCGCSAGAASPWALFLWPLAAVFAFRRRQTQV